MAYLTEDPQNPTTSRDGTNGRVFFYTQAATHLIFDVNGYHT